MSVVFDIWDANRYRSGHAAHRVNTIRRYSQALTQQDDAESRQRILLARAAAYHQDGRYDAAVTDCAIVLGANPQSETGLLCVRRALLALGRFVEYEEILERLSSEIDSTDEAAAMKDRIRRLLHEHRTGQYDFNEIRREVQLLRPALLDHATYSDPVEVRDSSARGRSLFVNRNIGAGELLLCEKALVYSFTGTSRSGDVGMLMNIETNRVSVGDQTVLIEATIQKLDRNPFLAAAVRTLHHGDFQSVKEREVDGRPVIDSPTSQLFSSDQADKSDDESSANTSSGIWPLASMISHSCISNVRRSFIGDLQIVRATRDIPASSELTFWYRVPNDQDTPEDVRKGLQQWGFVTARCVKKCRKLLRNRYGREMVCHLTSSPPWQSSECLMPIKLSGFSQLSRERSDRPV